MKISNVVSRLKPLFIDESKHLVKPVVVQFPVIDICNSRCQMCRIWENKKSNDITVEQLKNGLQNELFSNVESIGFNGGEPTLREDLDEIVRTCLDNLPKLRQISLITNAFKYLQVIEQVDKIGELLKGRGIYLDVMVSLDGFEEVHDLVRGRGGNFKNAQKVITHLKKCEFINNIRIGCTVIKENAFHLPDLLEFCIRNDLYVKYRQGVPHKRLYTENLIEPYALSFEEKYEFVEFLEGLIEHYETSLMQKYFYRSLIGQIINGKPRSAGCDWKYRGATITAKGELAYCAVQSKALMSDISSGDANKIYFENEPHLKDIIENKCDDCHHDYVGMPSPQQYRKIFIENLNGRFKIKEKLRRLPLFDKLNNYRNESNYHKFLDNYRKADVDVSGLISSEIDKKVLICGWYGTETLGDKAIIAGIINSVKNSLGNGVKFYVASLYTYITEMTKRQMSEFSGTKVLTIEQAISIAPQMDYVMFGGGPLMAIDALAPMQVIFEKAGQGKARRIVAGCGVGPLGSKRHNTSIKNILEMSDVRIYRDQKSKDYAQKLGVNIASDIVAEDPAFTWLSSVSKPTKGGAVNKDSKVLLLGLRDFPYQDYAKDLTESQSLKVKNTYEMTVVKALEELTSNDSNIVIKPLPMCTNHFGSDDRWFYRRLFRNSKIADSQLDYSLCGKEMEPLIYCEEFIKADGLLAMRFHSLVFGLALGTKSVALDYTLGKGKVNSLATRYNVPVISLLEIDKVDLTSMLKNMLAAEKSNPQVVLDNLQFELALKKQLQD